MVKISDFLKIYAENRTMNEKGILDKKAPLYYYLIKQNARETEYFPRSFQKEGEEWMMNGFDGKLKMQEVIIHGKETGI